MKFSSLLRITLAVVLMASTIMCTNAATKKSKKPRTHAQSGFVVSKGDTHTYADGALTTQDFSYKRGNFSMNIEYPVSGDESLVNSIRESIKNFVYSGYKGSLDTPEGLIKQNIALEKKEGTRELTEKISVAYSNNKVVTLKYQSYSYAGGAHGIGADLSQTFSLTDGKPLTVDMLPPISKMRPTLINALAKEGFEDVCFGNTSELDYGKPFIMDDGLHIIYGQYEIGPYVWGCPEVTLPLSQISNMLPQSTLNAYF